MSEKITFLGTGSAIPTLHRNPSAQALSVDDRIYLIDCAEATQLQMQRFGVKMQRLRAVFISHLHGDHFFGLVGLISTLHLQGRKARLDIFGPDGLEQILTIQLAYARHDLAYEINYHTVDTTVYQKVYTDDKIDVFTLPLQHRLPTAGYLFRRIPKPRKICREFILSQDIPLDWYPRIKAGEDYVDRMGNVFPNERITSPSPRFSYAYCSDTRYSEAIIPFVEEVDLLYHEASFSDAHADLAAAHLHSTARQAAIIARRARVKQLVIGHFSNRYSTPDLLLAEARSEFPPTFAAVDGAVWERGNLLR
ncbi:MAG: ribonuclease Z [Bacteroidia bacterium]|nr:ribonuclease Z [Bacteroidia bacterium]